MKLRHVYFANSLDAWNPEFWARESISILEENMVASRLVHRDFEPLVANFGDTVNTRKPGEFVATRKGVADDVTVQDATAANVAIVLNHHVHTSFAIKDEEMSKGLTNLVNVYLRPASLAMARYLDLVVLSQAAQFYTNSMGVCLGLSTTNAIQHLIDTRRVMNNNKAYQGGRNLILNSDTEAMLLQIQNFTDAQYVGDDGTALREASLGRKYQFDIYNCQNMGSVNAGNTVATGAINVSAGHAVGATSITVDGFSAAIANNSWVVVDGLPYRVSSTTGGATPTVIALQSPLRRAVADNAVVTSYTPAAIDLAAGYAAGWYKPLNIDGTTPAPQVGQWVTFGTTASSTIYTIIAVTAGSGGDWVITLDQPLAEALADNAAVNLGPAGRFNFGFHRNAVALMVRPLAEVAPGTGALSRTLAMPDKGLTMRATLAYDAKAQQHLMTMDFLAGVKVLDTALGAVLCG